MRGENQSLTDPCPDPTCRVAYWADIVARDAWVGKARDLADARLALGSAELVCTVFHQKGSKLCTCRRLTSAAGFEHRPDTQGCLLHDPVRAAEAARVRAKLIETTQRAGV